MAHDISHVTEHVHKYKTSDTNMNFDFILPTWAILLEKLTTSGSYGMIYHRYIW
jgi:hypothetical protein